MVELSRFTINKFPIDYFTLGLGYAWVATQDHQIYNGSY
jgi:hypothetical protein